MAALPSGENSRQGIGIICAALLALLLVWWLKAPGVILVLVLAILAWFYLALRPSSNEVQALRTSIKLSLDELDDILSEFDNFAFSQDSDHLADRTVHRPELLNTDSTDPDIENFHYEYSTAQRYSKRMHSHLAKHRLSVGQLERLLKISDERVAILRERWLAARRAAHKLGPGGAS